ncbi:MAG TPA: asparagine synthase (glutamine-hydrolyzing) [Pyrinomonadaceae bacterium]|jgi:asparagine synthase (glutamine-hydrolysing)|nr:asparagine synthase (glutamine-hydrolyzing) [Pyrinomonadaceae bacterium]
MCGIAGIVGFDPEKKIGSMLASVEHRGRDDSGTWVSEPIDSSGRRACLGHRRLAIIDTSPAGHEPMFSHDGRYVLTFNGEIYNYRELREELRTLGHQFKTDSDAEVLLAALSEWGWDAVTHLNGMFAFAVWDNKERTLTLVRDHVGIKPLYYSLISSRNDVPPTFLFGSEIKAILATELIKPELNREALHQFLTFLWSPDPNTLFANVKTVPPGHLLHFHYNELNLTQWWDVSFDKIEEGKNEAWWSERVLATLDRVVKMEMVADVPLGSFLSGGIDSSGIVAMMARHSNGRRISTYTVGIESEDLRYDIIPDDVRWARRVNEQLRTDYHEIMLKPIVADLLPKLVYHMEEPPIDMAIPSYLVSSAARETLTVMLSGMGGDEVFAGYPRQMAMKIASAFDPVPNLLRRPLMKTVARALPGGLPGKLTAPLRNAKKFARSAALDFEERYLGYGTYFTNEMKQRLYSDESRALTSEYDPYSTHKTYFARAVGAAPLNQLLYVDLKTFLPCLNLLTTDKTSMAANLEVRVPFLNREMIEMAARMPPRLKLRGLKRKYVLKRALENVLPKDVVWRKKAGFGAPIRSWLRGPLRPLIADLLSEETVRRRGIFRPNQVKRVLEANFSGREDYNLQVFQLLGLELWHRTFID